MINKYISINEDNTAYRIIEDEAVIVNLKKSTFHTLNSEATFIWNQLDGQSTLKEIAEKMSQEFDVDPETAAHDCMEFVSDLLDKNMVIMSSHPVEKS